MPEAHKRAVDIRNYKTSYRIKNWPEYEQSLRNRGDITIWLSRDAIDAWTPPKNGKPGGPGGNVSLDTICRVTRKTHSVVTRESLGDG